MTRVEIYMLRLRRYNDFCYYHASPGNPLWDARRAALWKKCERSGVRALAHSFPKRRRR